MTKDSYLALALFSMTLLLTVSCPQTLPLKHYYIMCTVSKALPTPSEGIELKCYFSFLLITSNTFLNQLFLQ